MEQLREGISGTIVIQFKKFRDVTLSELRNLQGNPEDDSYRFYLRRMMDSLMEKNIDLKLYEELQEETTNLYHISVGYTLEKDHNLILKKLDPKIYSVAFFWCR